MGHPFLFAVPQDFYDLVVAMTTKSKVRFKALTSQQTLLFPSNLGDKIAANHPVRIVDQVVDSLNIEDITSTYKGGGTSSYHPRMMIKVLFYSYFCNIYSCRQIEKVLQENIHFMWISGNSTPNFRTINDFRGKKLKGKIDFLFSEIIKLMSDLGFVSLEVQYIDGTKIEAASNRYTFLWKGSVEKNKAKLEKKIQGVLSDINNAIAQDNNVEDSEELPVIDSSIVKQRLLELNKRLDDFNKQQKKQVKKLVEEHLPKLENYEHQLTIFEGRNSFSKTDTDATFMRMKDDYMKNGQLKPAYNVQISTEDQFITNFSLHRRPGDTATLIPHMDQFAEFYEKQCDIAVADAGYGSEQNYEYFENNDVEAFVKYNYFHKEQKRKYKNDPFVATQLFYNEKDNFFVCPMGQRMECVGTYTRTSELGYKSTIHVYQAVNCNRCPMRGQCHKSKGERRIEINFKLQNYKKQAREKLLSEEGLKHRSKRPIEPEAVFGHIKNNHKFNRFTLRGLEKVKVEFGLNAIAHNLRKMMAKIIENKLKPTSLNQTTCFKPTNMKKDILIQDKIDTRTENLSTWKIAA